MSGHDFATILCGECRNYRPGRRDRETMRQYGRCRASGEVVERCMDCDNGQARLRYAEAHAPADRPIPVGPELVSQAAGAAQQLFERCVKMIRSEFEALVIRHLRAIGAAYQAVYPNNPHKISLIVGVEDKDASCFAFNAYWRSDNDFPVNIFVPTFGSEEDKKEEPCQVQLTEPNEEPCKSSPVLYQKSKSLATPRTNRLAQNIKALREARGMSVMDLAHDLNATKNSVWRWERGEWVPLLKTLCTLSNYFGCTLDDLVYGNSEEEEQS